MKKKWQYLKLKFNCALLHREQSYLLFRYTLLIVKVLGVIWSYKPNVV